LTLESCSSSLGSESMEMLEEVSGSDIACSRQGIEEDWSSHGRQWYHRDGGRGGATTAALVSSSPRGAGAGARNSALIASAVSPTVRHSAELPWATPRKQPGARRFSPSLSLNEFYKIYTSLSARKATSLRIFTHAIKRTRL
jgi:hypothetical protein